MRRGGRGPTPQQRRNRGTQGSYSNMLDRRRLPYFLYDMREVFRELKIEETIWAPLLSSIIAKASRISIKEAEDFLLQKITDGTLPKEAEKPLMDLLGRYGRMR